MRRNNSSGILFDKIRERMQRYRLRDEHTVYVHMLDKPVYYVFSKRYEETEISQYMVVGELLHQGLEKVLIEPEEKCRTVWLPRWIQYKINRRVGERFLHYAGSNPYVVLCGQCDALVEVNGRKYVVELKTTRKDVKIFKNSKVPKEWLCRPKIYAWLYNTYGGYLIIVNLVRGEEIDIFEKAYSDDEMERIIIKWLLGEWPNRTLYYN